MWTQQVQFIVSFTKLWTDKIEWPAQVWSLNMPRTMNVTEYIWTFANDFYARFTYMTRSGQLINQKLLEICTWIGLPIHQALCVIFHSFLDIFVHPTIRAIDGYTWGSGFLRAPEILQENQLRASRVYIFGGRNTKWFRRVKSRFAVDECAACPLSNESAGKIACCIIGIKRSKATNFRWNDWWIQSNQSKGSYNQMGTNAELNAEIHHGRHRHIQQQSHFEQSLTILRTISIRYRHGMYR